MTPVVTTALIVGAAVLVTSAVLTVSALLRRSDTAPDWGPYLIRRGMQ